MSPVKKKAHGQNFLRDITVVDTMLNSVASVPYASVLEIGPGDGFLSQAILEHRKCERLRAYEIDPDWVGVLRQKISDERFKVVCANVLDANFTNELRPHAPWILLANLPYHVTFPILRKLVLHRNLIPAGVVMVQEEVAQRLVAQTGRSQGQVSHYFQSFYEMKLLSKVLPESFEPAPKVTSRLVHFSVIAQRPKIKQEDRFWKFIAACYRAPRQTLANNLKGSEFAPLLETEQGRARKGLRAQELTPKEMRDFWHELI